MTDADSQKPDPQKPDPQKPDPETDVMAAVEATEPGARVLPEPELAPAPQPAPTQPAPIRPEQRPQAAPRSSGFVPAFLGGALMAVAGFAAAHYDVLKLRSANDTSALEAEVAAATATTTALQADVAALTARPAPDATLADRIGALEQTPAPGLAALEARLTTLDQRLTSIEALPSDGTGASPAALAALQAEVAALKGAGSVLGEDISKLAAEAEARLAEATAQAAAMKAEAEQIARTATAAAALGRVQAALESGGPFATALVDLGAEVPAELTAAAATGLPTLATLQDGFPQAARVALDAALRANMGESWAERVGSFLRSQTGARSLTPREGSDPDAVLSRAEAALGAGDLAVAVAEVRALPEAGLAAMAGWLAQADARLAGQSAVQALVAAVGQ